MFSAVQEEGFEQVVFGHHPVWGLKSIIAIHDTTLGPAFGGTRMMDYGSEAEALADVLRLARAMTYKNAAAGINFGGGKAVIIGDPERDKNEGLLRAFGRLVTSLGGRYITGVDVGTNQDDMIIIHQETDYNVSMPESYGGGGSTSAATAYGVFAGMKALAEEVFPDPRLKGKAVAVQGLGSVGRFLLEYLVEAGCEVYAAEVDERKIQKLREEFDFTAVPPEEIYDVEVDIFSPCALGEVLNDETIPRLKCSLVAGAANNQLADEERHCRMLEQRGITYGVDYILNAGGVINNAHQFPGYNRERAYRQIEGIAATARQVHRLAEEEGITAVGAARRKAEERLTMAGELKKWYLPQEKGNTR